MRVKELHRTAALVLAGWYLIVPMQTPPTGAANVSASPTSTIWHTYETQQKCERDREFLRHDLITGPHMQSAQCVPSAPDPPATQRK
jgi:hypothetical protein